MVFLGPPVYMQFMPGSFEVMTDGVTEIYVASSFTVMHSWIFVAVKCGCE